MRLPSHDFCKEVVEPGSQPGLPAGAVGIRTDGDFAAFAALPYRFKYVPTAEIVAICWPNVEQPTICPDSGDYWWTAIYDDTLEVPGEPFELWCRVTYPDGSVEEQRHTTHVERSDAEATVRRFRAGLGKGHTLTLQTREWKGGSRTVLATYAYPEDQVA